MEFDVTVDAAGPSGPVEQLTYRIDVEILAKTLVGERPHQRIEDRLGAIADSLDSVTNTYGSANAQALRAEQQRRLEEMRRQTEEEG
ncbi:hypothetical protein [Streptomyces liangshanensis]|uniref:Uncharacterized protein n=1 Tax=Streptomyces liangshanensis TaxID=2717324 RepID=A0A6G9H782_9ACTN|nr:hypothetical protein [Streptomyces liangshanensis]QIQ06166.1 hypothetical protein HA039_31075 [Streptomyces liangshanensis]